MEYENGIKYLGHSYSEEHKMLDKNKK